MSILRVATPESMAAWATAGAILTIRRGIEGLGNQVVRAEVEVGAAVGLGHHVGLLGLGQLGDGLHAGQLHLLVDLGGARIQGAAEDEGEAQHVVDLVRVVRTAGGDDGVGAHFLGQLRHDLRGRVGQREDQRLVGHGLDHLGLEHAGGGQAEEDVGADHASARVRNSVFWAKRALVGSMFSSRPT
jgi:hypothetical protein